MTTVGTGKYTYTLIQDWAKLPPGQAFGTVSAVATDSQDRVYAFQRAEPPVLVFDRDGNFLSSWGNGAFVNPHGIYIADGDRSVDNHTVIHHVAPNCFSRERYKGVLSGRARGAFSGKIHVHQDAQKTNAEQANDSLLMSGDAVSLSRPRLEIYADDVRCTHGATIGELDEDALFYLRSRGIPHAEARLMMVRAFAADMLSSLSNEALREHVETLFSEHLPLGEDS